MLSPTLSLRKEHFPDGFPFRSDDKTNLRLINAPWQIHQVGNLQKRYVALSKQPVGFKSSVTWGEDLRRSLEDPTYQTFLGGYQTFLGGPQTSRPCFKKCPLVNIQKAIENGPVEIVDFPIQNGGSFHCKLLVHQAGYS